MARPESILRSEPNLIMSRRMDEPEPFILDDITLTEFYPALNQFPDAKAFYQGVLGLFRRTLLLLPPFSRSKNSRGRSTATSQNISSTSESSHTSSTDDSPIKKHKKISLPTSSSGNTLVSIDSHHMQHQSAHVVLPNDLKNDQENKIDGFIRDVVESRSHHVLLETLLKYFTLFRPITTTPFQNMVKSYDAVVLRLIFKAKYNYQTDFKNQIDSIFNITYTSSDGTHSNFNNFEISAISSYFFQIEAVVGKFQSKILSINPGKLTLPQVDNIFAQLYPQSVLDEYKSVIDKVASTLIQSSSPPKSTRSDLEIQSKIAEANERAEKEN